MPQIPIYIRDEVYDGLVKEGFDVKKVIVGILEEKWQQIQKEKRGIKQGVRKNKMDVSLNFVETILLPTILDMLTGGKQK